MTDTRSSLPGIGDEGQHDHILGSIDHGAIHRYARQGGPSAPCEPVAMWACWGGRQLADAARSDDTLGDVGSRSTITIVLRSDTKAAPVVGSGVDDLLDTVRGRQ